jgi:hypothetical protein
MPFQSKRHPLFIEKRLDFGLLSGFRFEPDK